MDANELETVSEDEGDGETVSETVNIDENAPNSRTYLQVSVLQQINIKAKMG